MRSGRQVELPRFHPRHIQDHVHQGEKLPASLIDGGRVFQGLLAGQRAARIAHHRLGEADHHVERGPQLVAHRREKASLWTGG